MQALWIVFCLAAFCAAASAAPEPGLVAHWTFDEGAGEVARDVSGNGHDGKVHGAAWVPSPRGHALRFDGVDDYVDCGRAESLKVAGDLTLAAWVKAEDVSGRNRMIFGDAAGLTVNRNYNLRIDREGLRFEYGDGTAYGVVLDDDPFPVGSWQLLVVVFEHPRYTIYRNDRLILEGESSVAITPTNGDSRRIGGWFAGFFKGDIDEVRLYNRALAHHEVLKLLGKDAAAPAVQVTPRFRFLHREMTCEVRCSSTLAAGAQAEVTVRDTARGNDWQRRQVPLQETRPGSGRWQAALTLSTEGLLGGEHEVLATLRDADGKEVGRSAAAFTYPGEKPEWIGSTEGRSDRVLPPFEPLKLAQAGQGVTVSPWGRRYDLGRTPFFSQIRSRDADLLAGPIRLLATIDGREVQWSPAPPRVAKKGDAACALVQTLQGGGAEVSIETTLEVDGLAKLQWALAARRAATLDRLIVEIPLKEEHARYLYTWPKITSRALTGAHAGPFQPIVWLGDEDRGLQWVCESERNWAPADPAKSIEVVPEGDTRVLRLNLITAPVRLAAGEKRDYLFGLQATPVKPITQDAWDYRIVRNPWYGWELDLPDKQVDGKPALQYYAEKGVKAMLILRWWDAFAYPLPIGQEERFRRLVAECHRYGIKVLPYVGGFLLSEEAPEAPFFGEEMRVNPSGPFTLRMPGLKPQTGIYACQRGPWQDFVVHGIGRLMDEYDVDGVYLDTTTIPWACRNELHGCGYVGPDGKRACAYPVFSVREDLRRIYTAVKQRKPDGIVDLHVYDCMNAPGLAWATTYWNGEQLPRRDYKPDALPLERFRTEFMGRNWGVPADVLYYTMGGNRQSWALALLHDVPVRAENLADLDTEAALWTVRETFGVKQARWLPYWNNGEAVSAEPKGCYASLYAHPQGRVLLYVSNLGKGQAAVRVKLSLGRLGLPADAPAADAVTGKPVAFQDGVLALDLPSQDWRVLWIGEGAPAGRK